MAAGLIGKYFVPRGEFNLRALDRTADKERLILRLRLIKIKSRFNY